MELLASDMITRALVFVSRKNYPQAQKIMNETKRILHTVLHIISKTLPPPNSEGTTMRNRKDILTLAAVRAMQAILQDPQILSEALEENVDVFAHDQRNFGAQQVRSVLMLLTRVGLTNHCRLWYCVTRKAGVDAVPPSDYSGVWTTR